VCVAGRIVFHVEGADVDLGPGDRLELSAGVEHGASVGEAGVECVEAPRPGPDGVEDATDTLDLLP